MFTDGFLKYGSRTVEVTQTLADFGLKRGDDGTLVRLDGSRIKKHAAFEDWQHRLKRGERLPRGRWFRNKRPGRPLVMMDEVHTLWQIDTAPRGPRRPFCEKTDV